jgi:hypothetical protein
MLQLILRRAEQAPKRLMFQLNLPDFFVLCAKLAVRRGPLANELGLEPRLLLAGPSTMGGDDVQGPIPPARGFHAGPGEIPFECRPRVGFPREPLDEFHLARRRGSEGGGGAVLRLLMRRRGVGRVAPTRRARQRVPLGRVIASEARRAPPQMPDPLVVSCASAAAFEVGFAAADASRAPLLGLAAGDPSAAVAQSCALLIGLLRQTRRPPSAA